MTKPQSPTALGGAYRIAQGGRIDRSKRLSFTLDGKSFEGFAGDTVASTLLAHGEHLVARSFKYHRPRGILAAGVEESNALLTVGDHGTREPNIAATVLELEAGLQTRTQNAWPSVRFDAMAITSLLSPLFVAGFYYKTFMGPTRSAWMLYEHFIRKAAGLGASVNDADVHRYDWHNDYTDVLVIGSGAAGLSAALHAARAGSQVMLVEQDFVFGGALLSHPASSAKGQWLATMLADLQAAGNVRMLTRSTAFGVYDGNTVGVIERSAPGVANAAYGVPRQRMRTVRAGAIVMASGALERPLVFAGNDKPGVMLSGAVGTYVNRYAVAPGKRAVFCVNNDAAYADALALAHAGAHVNLVDLRGAVQPSLIAAASSAGITVQTGSTVTDVYGRLHAKGVRVAGYDAISGRVMGGPMELEADLVAMSGGWTPTVHLSSHRNVRPVYRADISCFVPGGFDRAQFGAGAMVGCQTWSAAIESGWQAGAQAAAVSGHRLDQTAPKLEDETSIAFVPAGTLLAAQPSDKAFLDFQNDVTVEDVALAHREGYQSVEHLKRYTTLGMGTDQGKTSNLNGLGLMAAARGIDIAAAGTTTFRPPYTPVSLGALAGRNVGAHFQPERRTAMHNWHETHGGVKMEAGLWLRPLWYRTHGATLGEAYKTEMEFVRNSVGIADTSTLGKIDVQGPDAAEFLDRVYVNGFSKLPVGKARYGFMLREDGIVMDDGTTTRISETQFFMTTTTAQAARVMSHLEFLLQVVWPTLRVTVASVTDQWAAMSVAGPRARDALQAAFPHIDLSNTALPFMGLLDTQGNGALEGVTLRILRLTFSGELAYEIFTPTHHGLAVWEHVISTGKPWNMRPYGLEALGSLRIEKGHVVGSEMDGRTTLDDLGAGKMASKTKNFWGDALRHSQHLARPNRPALVGLEAVDDKQPPSNGSILFFADDAIQGHGRGHVTSTTFSHSVGKAIALGLLQGGTAHVGEEIIATSPTQERTYRLRVVDPCFLDAEGVRYRV
jgi:sarcosine oxidase subunit alpha